MNELTEDDFNVNPIPDKISSGERQWIQVEKSRDNDNSIFVEKDGLKTEMAKWKFPLHFIDFVCILLFERRDRLSETKAAPLEQKVGVAGRLHL